MSIRRSLSLLWLLSATLLVGCGDAGETMQETQNVFPEADAYYRDHRTIPEDVQAALAAGTLGEESLARKMSGFPKFFREKSIAELPADLVWENGADLPEFGSDEAKKGGVLRGSLQDFPRTLRRVGPDSNGSFRPYLLDWNSMSFAQRHPNKTELTRSGFHFFPGIASEWALDTERHKVYVRIHPQARWSDGHPITTEDVFFTFFFFNSDYIRAPWYQNYYSETYAFIERYSDHVFAIKLRNAKPDFAYRVLGLEPVPAHFFKALGPDFIDRYQWRFVPTSGPYVIHDKDIRKGRFIALSRNKGWWAKDLKFWRYRFNFDRIELAVIRDVAKAFEAFRKGDLDMFGLSLPEYWYEKMPNEDPLVQSGYVEKKVFYNDKPRPTYGLWINSGKPLLDNLSVRLGIQFAVNWDLVIEKYFRGDYTRLKTMSDGYGDFTSPLLQSRPFDTTRALAHFAKAGFTRRGDDGILLNEKGERLSFSVTTGYQTLKGVLLILREEAAKGGLDLRVEVLDGTAAWKKIQEKKHDLAFSAFAVSAEMYPRYWETHHSDNAYDQAFLPDGRINPERKLKTQTNNLMSMAVSDIDADIETYRRSSSLSQMRGLAFAIEQASFDYGAFVPAFQAPFFRLGHWRWIRFPESFNVKLASGASEYFLAWIDEPTKTETLQARETGKTFPPVIKTYDQFCVDCGP